MPFVDPDTVSPASGGGFVDPDAQKDRSLRSWSDFIGSSLWKGVGNLVGTPADTIMNVGELGQAGANVAAHELFGTSPQPLSDRSKIPLTGEWNNRMLAKLGLIAPDSAPRTGPERVLDAALEAAPSGVVGGPKTVPGLAKNVAGASLSGAASQTAGEAGGGVGTQELAGMAAPLSVAGVRGGVNAARRAVVGDTNVPERMRQFREGGVPNPTAGMVTGSKPLQAAEAVSAATPGGSTKFIAESEKRNAALEGRVGKLVSDMAPGGASPANAGNAITKGIQSFRDRFLGRQKTLEDEASSHVAPEDRFPVSNTREFLREAATLTPGEEALSTATGSGALRAWHEALEQDLAATKEPETPPPVTTTTPERWKVVNGRAVLEPETSQTTQPKPKEPAPVTRTRTWREGDEFKTLSEEAKTKRVEAREAKDTISYETLRRWRSNIGRAIGTPGMFPDVSKNDLRGLYEALTRDMEAGFEEQGPAARKAWDRAQRHYRVGKDRERQVLEHVADKDSPEKVFAAATNGTKEGASSLVRLLNSLPVKNRQVVAASMLNRLGRTAPDAPFSLDKFVTDWDKLHGDAKKALLQGKSAEDMDTIAKAAKDVKDAGKIYYNPSGTGRLSAHVETASSVTGALTLALTGHPGAAAGVLAATGTHMVANRYFAAAVHDPKFIHWLAQGTKVPMNNSKQYAARLYEIAKHNQDEDEAEGEAAIAISLGAEQ